MKSYPPVDVRVDAQPNEVTFNTSAAILNLSLEDQVLSLELRSRDKVLIDGWDIDAGERVARIELQSGERIYGFGDKRAALDQRGHKVEMLNRDAFASETNESYKSIPFFMSSAGYGLFFHNSIRPSSTSAPGHGRLDLTATAARWISMCSSAPEGGISQYTELTGRPAMLPRWAFGYHQAKASYEGRDAFKVAARCASASCRSTSSITTTGTRRRPAGFHRFPVGPLPRPADARVSACRCSAS